MAAGLIGTTGTITGTTTMVITVARDTTATDPAGNIHSLAHVFPLPEMAAGSAARTQPVLSGTLLNRSRGTEVRGLEKFVSLRFVLLLVFIALGAALHEAGKVGFWGMLAIMMAPNIMFALLRTGKPRSASE